MTTATPHARDAPVHAARGTPERKTPDGLPSGVPAIRGKRIEIHARRADAHIGASPLRTRDQNVALNSTPQVRGSFMKPVRLLKSMPPTIASSSVMLRPNTATS